MRTLESQLLLLLRSKLEVRYREELEVQARRVALLREKRGDSATALAKLQAEYEALGGAFGKKPGTRPKPPVG